MMGISWTNEQLRAINEKSGDGNVLVSAAAGSGKTAVLVERIINKVINEGTDIDRLLVVTFTEAAAAEMRDKIIRRLYRQYNSAGAGDTERIKAQIKAAQSADIMTIDAFCLRALRNNFYVMGIDPNFRILDDAQAQLIADEAINSLFDRLYNADDAGFYHLLNIYASNRNDEKLRQIVTAIYEFTQSFADPIGWLSEKSQMYSEDMTDSVWLRELIPDLYIHNNGRRFYYLFLLLAQDMAKNLTGDMEADVLDEDIKYEIINAYGEMAITLYKLIDAAEEFSNASQWNDANKVYIKYFLSDEFDHLTLLNRPKDISVELEDWKFYCRIRNEFKKEFEEFASTFEYDDKSLNSVFKAGDVSTLIHELTWLVGEFAKEFARAKELRNVKGFGDIEQLVCKMFMENEDIRNGYKEKYDEILIDEYQDTNGLQDTIFESISRDRKNIFMVGDMKQSIYRFRGGDPSIFKEKSRLYANSQNRHSRIDLSQNFRSRQEILRSVNYIFNGIMSERVGDVDYKNEQIVRHSDSDVWDDAYKSEMHFIAYGVDDDTDEDITSMGVEAEFIADKIEELLNSKFQIDDASGKRPLRCGDITILVRSVKNGNGQILLDRLKKRGICAAVETEDYFTRREIQLMLSVLSVIDNHLQDIPLAALMRSPIGNFTDNDMAQIRIFTPHGCLYDALCAYEAEDDNTINLQNKCKKLIQSLKHWREEVKRKSVANLIWTIYEETGFYDFMGALEGGDEAQANLRLLYERAKYYEQSGFKGLFNFVRYLDLIRSRGNDLSSATGSSERKDTVRIMTMHKSKGLEFPVVFLAGMGKRFNLTSSIDGIHIHKDLGFGACYVSEKKHYMKDTIFSRLVKEQNRREDIAEEMRLLYVAMTRAKEKLIVVASKQIRPTQKRDFDEIFNDMISDLKRKKLPEDAISYSDWICPYVMRDNDTWNFYLHKNKMMSFKEPDHEILQKEALKISDELREVIDKNFSYTYEYPNSGYIPAKISVTALKQRQNEEIDTENADRKYEYDPIYMDEMPEFMDNKKRGAQVGTAHHQVMAYIDLDKLRALDEEEYEEFAKSEILRIANSGEIETYYYENENMKNSIAKHIAAFFKSRQGRAMLSSDKVYREKPFQIEIGADEYDSGLEEKYSSERVILQGVIDCYFETEDGVVLLDYKTDRCRTKDDIKKVADKYAVQLELYANAIESITGKSVGEKYLYLFVPDKAVKI